MRRRRRKSIPGEVQLNLAAMLDMAFQLLAFFILTFKPAGDEGHLAVRMPPPRPITKVADTQEVGSDAQNKSAVQGLDTLVVTAISDGNGGIKELRIGEVEPTASLHVFEERLSTVFAAPQTPFNQVILQVGSGLHYQGLMQLLDVCTRIKLPSGERLSKVSFVELPERGIAGVSNPSPKAES